MRIGTISPYSSVYHGRVFSKDACKEDENDLVVVRKRLKPLTVNLALSDTGTAIGLMLKILQFLWLFTGKEVSKMTWPASQTQYVTTVSSNYNATTELRNSLATRRRWASDKSLSF